MTNLKKSTSQNLMTTNRNILDIEDIDQEVLPDEMDVWVMEQLKSIGCDSANCVLDLSASELERRAHLPQDTFEDVMRLVQAEFEEE